MKRFHLFSKKILPLMLTIAFVFSSMSASHIALAATTKTADYKAGDNISLGTLDGKPINWTILSIDTTTRQALVVARTPLMSVSVTNYKAQIASTSAGNSSSYTPWASNLWRAWLNGPFYQNCFNDAERALINATTLTKESQQQNIINFYHDTKLDAYYLNNNKTKNSMNLSILNNQIETTDYLFFLSSDEYSSYKDKISTDIKGTWPLRTSAYDDPVKILYVDDSKQLIYRMYTYDAGLSGVRPAMKITLASTATTSTSTTATTTSSDTSTTASTTSSTSDTSSSSDTASSSTTTTSSNQTTSRRQYANNANDSSTATGNTINLPSDSQYSLKKNGTALVTLDLSYLNSSNKDYTVTYTSSNAGVFTVSSTGLVTASGSSGSATLTVRMKKSNGRTYTMTCRIDVA